MSMHVMWQRPRLSALAALSLAILTILAPARRGRAALSIRATSSNVAIMGYDPVAYFTDGRATKGSEEFAYDWLGATWQFANAEHRDLRRHPDPVRAAIRRLMRLGRGQE